MLRADKFRILNKPVCNVLIFPEKSARARLFCAKLTDAPNNSAGLFDSCFLPRRTFSDRNNFTPGLHNRRPPISFGAVEMII